MEPSRQPRRARVYPKARAFNPEASPDAALVYFRARRVAAPNDASFQQAIVPILLTFVAAVIVGVTIAFLWSRPAHARDDGRYADSPLKSWFDQLASGKGLCCSFADGRSIADVDWDVRDGRYRVRLQGEWIDVPPAALVNEPNRFGPAVVWPYLDTDGQTQIRCFLPGAGA